MFTILSALPSQLGTFREIDDDASTLYAAHGICIELGPDDAFSRAEVARWLRSAELGRAFVAQDEAGALVGFAALDRVDGEPYLDQLAVRVAAMRRGVGGGLLTRAVEWARSSDGSALWLTTYAHLSFNRAFYARHGFAVVIEAECGPGIRHHLDEQRHHLPAPGQRVAMRRLLY